MRSAAIYVLVGAAGLSAPAHAQIAPSGAPAVLFRSDAAGARAEPAFDPEPIRAGALLITPAIALKAAADSNVFNTPGGSDGDLSIAAEPYLGITTNWARHRISLVAAARLTRFAELGRENSEEFEFSAEGRLDDAGLLDLADNESVTAAAGYARRIEARSTGGVNIVAGEPSAYSLVTIGFAGRGEYGSVRLSGGSTATFRDYDAIELRGGGSVQQSFRNARLIVSQGRMDVRVGPSLAAFASSAAAWTASNESTAAVSRDAIGAVLLAGIRGDITRLLVAELSAGYRRRVFEDPQVQNYGGFTYAATVDWYPTELVSIRVATDQDFENSGLPTVAGILTRTLRSDVYYDPLRNLRISASAEYRRERYRELSITSEALELAVRGFLRLGRRLQFGAFAKYRNRDVPSSSIISGYRGVGAGLMLTGNL